MLRKALTLIMIVLILAACSSNAGNEPTIEESPAPPTATTQPTNTTAPTETPEPTFTPSPTPLPGIVTHPIDEMDITIPWLSWDPANAAITRYYAFNLAEPPFDNVLVRKAFIAALDREALYEIFLPVNKRTSHPDSLQLASSLTPPSILGLDLTGELGIPYDPEQARTYLSEAGYEDVSSFPEIDFWVPYSGFVDPGINVVLAREAAAMWQENLGIQVNIREINSNYYGQIRENPPNIFWFGWIADFNDPKNFLNELMNSSSGNNLGQYNNPDFDNLVNEAENWDSYPEDRLNLYLEAERLLIEEDAAIIPLFYSLTVYPE